MNPSLPKNRNAKALNTPAGTDAFLAAWRWWLPPALVALALALIFQDPFIGDWDGLDYTVLALNGRPSTMALGRSFFIFFNRSLYLLAHALFQLRPADAYLLFKYATIIEGFFACIACWVLARDLTNSLRVATIAALLIATSPTFVIYSGQVMTDVPSLLLVTLSLIVHLRAIRERKLLMMLAGAALLGACVNVRETAIFFSPWLVFAPFVCGWKPGRREVASIALTCAVFLLVAFGPFAFWFLSDIDSYRDAWYVWRETMQQEAARHPVSLHSLLPFFFYFFLAGPIVLVQLPVAAWKEWKSRGLSPLLFLAAVGLWSNFLLIFNYSTSVNWRYFLTGLPGLVPLVAFHLMRSQTKRMQNEQRAFWSIALAIALVTVLVGIYSKPTSREFLLKRAQTKDYISRLKLLPPDAVVMAGAQTIAVTYWRGIGAGQWTEIGTGAGWPGTQLPSLTENYLKNGRRVFLDADAKWWAACGWQLDETLALVRLESQFRFRHVSGTIYEIRPLDDETAQDSPNLQSLLPENRPDERKSCTGVNKSQ